MFCQVHVPDEIPLRCAAGCDEVKAHGIGDAQSLSVDVGDTESLLFISGKWLTQEVLLEPVVRRYQMTCSVFGRLESAIVSSSCVVAKWLRC